MKINTGRTDLEQMRLDQFLGKLASNSPVPGGGGASALAGALGIALGNMVGALTVGKKKYAGVEAEIVSVNEKACALRGELLELAGKDAEAFEPLAAAYSIPKDDPGKDAVMEKALREAAEVPLSIMKKCCEAIALTAVYAEKGSAIAISDAGCAAAMCRAALESAALNVYINTKSMQDRQLAESMNREAAGMLEKYCRMASQIYETITGEVT